LIQAGTGLTVYWAFAINDAGWIMASALDAQSHFHKVLLTPDGGGAPRGPDPGDFRLLTPVHEATPIAEITSEPAATARPKGAPLQTDAAPVRATDGVFFGNHHSPAPAHGSDWVVEQPVSSWPLIVAIV